MPRSALAELYGNSVFNNLRNYQTIFKAAHHLRPSVVYCPPVSLYPHQFILLSDFLIIAIPVGVKMYLVVCDVHFLVAVMLNISSLLNVCVSPLENVYSNPLLVFQLGVCFSSLFLGLLEFFVHS